MLLPLRKKGSIRTLAGISGTVNGGRAVRARVCRPRSGGGRVLGQISSKERRQRRTTRHCRNTISPVTANISSVAAAALPKRRNSKPVRYTYSGRYVVENGGGPPPVTTKAGRKLTCR